MDENIKWEKFTDILHYYKEHNLSGNQEDIVQLLRETQEIFGAIPKEAQEKISTILDVKQAFIEILLKRYPSLKSEAFDKKIVVCTGPRCMVKGGADILRAVESELNINNGEVTKDGLYQLTTRNCLKNCKTAPNLMIDEKVHKNLTLNGVKELLDKKKKTSHRVPNNKDKKKDVY